MIKRILVGLHDLVRSQSATRQAIEFAHHFGAGLTGITLLNRSQLERTGPVPIGAGHAAAELCEHRIREAEEAIAQATAFFETTCRDAGVTHSLLSERTDPLDGLIAVSRYYDLIVGGLQHLFGDDDSAAAPVALTRLVQEGVRPFVAVTAEHRAVHRVLIAYSGSVGSAKTMKRYVQMNPWPGASVRIVTFALQADVAQERLHDAAEYCHAHGLTPETDHVALPPKNQLLPYAEEWGADAIILGNSARSLLLKRIFGETALQTIRNAKCTLFLCQ